MSQEKNKVFVGGISNNTGEADIRDLFRKVGDILDVQMHQRYCFVQFEDHETATRAIKERD